MTGAILILIDGLQVEALKKADTPFIDNLMHTGSWTLEAKTVVPSITLPAHFSIFHSVRPIDHNVLTNTGNPLASTSVTGFFQYVKSYGKKTAAFYSWEPLRNLAPPGALDFSYMKKVTHEDACDHIIATAAMDHIVNDKPDFCFIYLEKTDSTGHAAGFGSEKYLKAIEKADKAVGNILTCLQESGLMNSYHILLMSDHGGFGFHHEGNEPEVMTVPWILNGPMIKNNHQIQKYVRIIDAAPTLSKVMGIPAHYSWQGSFPEEALL